MTLLPLFPLQKVLFPGMPLELRIFEERYKIMINECRQSGSPFGIVLIESGQEVGGSAIPHVVGCTAHISRVQDLPGGRMLIVVVGRERFRIEELHHDRPYLYGTVKMLSDDHEVSSKQLLHQSRSLRTLLLQYLNILKKAGEVQFEEAQIPREPVALSYLSAMLLQSDEMVKQSLLETEDTPTLLQRLLKLYWREITVLETLLIPPDVMEDGTPFSTN